MVRNSAIYLLSSVLSRSAPFLLLPWLTLYLTPSEMGLVALFQLTMLASAALFGLSLNVSISRFFISGKREDLAELISSTLIVLAVSSCLLFVTVMVVRPHLGESLSGLGDTLFWLPVIAFCSMTYNIAQTLARMNEKPWHYLRYEMTLALSGVSLAVLFVGLFEWSWIGYVAGAGVSVMLVGLAALMELRRGGLLMWPSGLKWVRRIISLCVPLVPHAVAGVALAYCDRLMIEHYLGLDAVGVYTVGYQFGMGVLLITDAFAKAWGPWFYRQMTGAGVEGRSRIVKISYAYVLLLAVMTAVYAALTTWLTPMVVSDRFAGSAEFVPMVCLGYFFFGLYQMFFHYLVWSKRVHFVAFATVVAAVLNVVLNSIWIPHYGAVGAAYSTVVSYAASSALVGLVAIRVVPMPWLGLSSNDV